MELEDQPLIFLKATSEIANNMSKLNPVNQKPSQLNVVYPKGLSLDHYFSPFFINDLPNCSTLGKFRIFADGTTVFFHCKNDQEPILTGETIMT